MTKLLDSSFWIEYLHNKANSNIIESDEILLLSSLSLFEIKRKSIRNKVPIDKIMKAIEFIKKRSLIIPVTAEIAENAVDVSIKDNLATVDSIIYSTAILKNSTLFTLDNDFRGLKDVTIL